MRPAVISPARLLPHQPPMDCATFSSALATVSPLKRKPASPPGHAAAMAAASMRSLVTPARSRMRWKHCACVVPPMPTASAVPTLGVKPTMRTSPSLGQVAHCPTGMLAARSAAEFG